MESSVDLLVVSKKYIDNPTEENKERFLKELNSTNSSVTMTYVLSSISRIIEDIKNIEACSFVITTIDRKLRNYRPQHTIFDEEAGIFRQL